MKKISQSLKHFQFLTDTLTAYYDSTLTVTDQILNITEASYMPSWLMLKMISSVKIYTFKTVIAEQKKTYQKTYGHFDKTTTYQNNY